MDDGDGRLRRLNGPRKQHVVGETLGKEQKRESCAKQPHELIELEFRVLKR